MRAADAPATPTSAGVARRRRLLIGGGLVLALAVGAAATQYLNVWQYQQSTDNAYVRADITPVAAKVDGYVATVAIADNQRVKAGDLLVRIDPSDYAAKVAAATANLATARANLAQARAAAVGAGSQLGAQVAATGVARANLTATQAAAVKANADAVRYRDLAKSGWVTRAQLDQVNAAAASAVANVAAARAAIVQAQGVTGVSVSGRVKAAADIEAAQAQVAAAQAALASARLDLGRTELRAPVDGIVGNRSVRPGQLVRNGAQLLSVVPVQAAYVVANFKETQLDHMKAGQPVEIAVDAYPGLHLSGRVESLAPTSGAQFALIPTDTATGNFTKIVQRVPVRITIDRTQLGAELLRPGLSVEATVNTRG
ncbi:HlyD family secretion protein [Sandaracinobacteroides saxicola]|uniref:HlyD family secretion protein n=2 Tax=Sandaracinobacteroides saxicola TaxID=2759707 RepID=A0A7G5IMK9_9SPHN|nr:HlyD family secretion protein [Sandaracinobacteroides saxicola]